MWVARTGRVAPLLYQLVDTTPTNLDEDQRTEIRQHFGAVMCRCVQLEHHLIVVSELLAAHGIRCVTLKGGATAHLDYKDPACREFSDIDLLVDPSDLARATQLVEGLGWRQGYALPAGHHRFTHAVTFVYEGMELDLHQRIAHRALGLLLTTADLMARAEPFRIAGTELLALDDVDRFLHSTIHAVASGRRAQRLSTLADVLIVAESRPDLAGLALERAERQRVRSLMECGIRDAYSTARLDVSTPWLSAMDQPIRRRDRLVDRAYLEDYRRPIFEELAHLRLIDGWRDRTRYVTGYFVDEEDGFSQRARYLWSKLFRR